MQQVSEYRTELKVDHLKDLIQHSNHNKNFHAIVKVTGSRFRKIISDYFSLNGIGIEGLLDNYSAYYSFVILTDLDNEGRGNSYKVMKTNIKEERGKCNNCDCNKKRWLNPETGSCYYKEMIAHNYTTKLK
jgi:hypothetical protein